MHSELPREVAGPAQVKPVVEFHEVSKWYGNVIGINKLTINVPAGVTGLLGPNGAGKSTLLQLATGQLFPSQGTVRVLNQVLRENPALYQKDFDPSGFAWVIGDDRDQSIIGRLLRQVIEFRAGEADRKRTPRSFRARDAQQQRM